MKVLKSPEEQIMTVWELCSSIYIQQGFKLDFPKDTEITKTYQWRYAKALTVKFDKWKFDDETSKQFIRIAVRRCKEAGVLKKGLSVLHQSNMLEACYDELKTKANRNRQHIESIKHTHQWIINKSEGNLFETLLYRPYPDEFCNFVKWVQARHISRLYLSLSRTCSKALLRLATTFPDERKLLPKTTTLYMLWSEFTKDDENVTKAKQILGSDWRKLCM